MRAADLTDVLRTIKAVRSTIVCHPELEQAMRDLVDACGLGGLVTVVANPHVPPDKAYVVADSALEVPNEGR